jgi:hypothetical protein
MGLKLKVKFKKFKKSIKKLGKKVGKAIKKIAKVTGIDKIIRKVGRGIKKAFVSFGKFMNKIGVVGQIAMMFILPAVGTTLMSGLNAFGTAAAASSNFIVKGLGHLAKFTHTAISTTGNVFSNVTKGVVDTLGNFGKTLGKKLGLETGGAQNFFGSGDSAFSRSFTNENVSRFQNLTLGEKEYQAKLLKGMEKINAEAAAKATMENAIQKGYEGKSSDLMRSQNRSQLTSKGIELPPTELKTAIVEPIPQIDTSSVRESLLGDVSVADPSTFIDKTQLDNLNKAVIDPSAVTQTQLTPIDSRSLLEKTTDFGKGLVKAGKDKLQEGIDFITDPKEVMDFGVEKTGELVDKAAQGYTVLRAKEEAYKDTYADEGLVDPRTPIQEVSAYSSYVPTIVQAAEVGSGRFEDITNNYESLAYSNAYYGNTAYQLDNGYNDYLRRVGQESQFNPNNWGGMS